MTAWSSLTWTTARAGGITAYILLTLSMVLGLALSMRWQRPNWPRLITNELHSYLTLLSLVFIGVHTLAILADPYIKFGLQDVLVPLATTYRTAWVAFGIVGTYLALAVWISTQLRARIGFAAWRKLHFATFLVYVFATLHGIGTGSDTRTLWGLALYLGSVLAVGGLLTLRLLQPTKKAVDGHPMLAGITVFSLILGTLWTINGPLQPGWAAANNGPARTTVQNTVQQPAAQQPAAPQPGIQGGGGSIPSWSGGRHHHEDRWGGGGDDGNWQGGQGGFGGDD